MPKSQFIDPKTVRAKSEITFKSIPVNHYSKTIKDELKNYSKDDLVRIYRDMVIIREFESMINEIKIKSEYNGIKYNHPGPAHLSIGQEAAAVGMAYQLGVDDYIFGSHRSHGEILAKGLSAVNKLSDSELMDIMKNFFGGACLRAVENGHKGTVKELAENFLLYGALAEIFGRATGFNRGLGGSMHAFFTPFGVYPNNAIVGGSGDISVGAALYKRVNQKPGIVVANIGDASLGCGPVWEGLWFSVMDQFNKLWEGAHKGGLPIIFNIMNNQYGMGGQTSGETMGYDIVARIGAGLNAEQMHAERVDGYNPLAVIDAFKRKIEILDKKRGPVLLDTLTYRISGHSPSDASSYRTAEEIEAWKSSDSIVEYGNKLTAAGIVKDSDLEKIKKETTALITKVLTLSIDDAVSPRLDLVQAPETIGDMMFSNGSVEKMENRPVDVNHAMAENPRVQAIAKKRTFRS